MAHTVCSSLAAFAIATALISAYEPVVDPRAVLEAIAIGQSRADAERQRFHQPYRSLVNRPPVDSVEVMTPFRRVVLAVESRAATGDRIFTQREGLAIAAEAAGRVDVILETTFHPLNTYVAVPAYEIHFVAAGSAAGPISPSRVDRVPRYQLGFDGRARPQGPGTGTPLAGGTVTASFDGRALNPNGLYDVVITEAGKELARTKVDLRTMR